MIAKVKPQPHFIRDYRELVGNLATRHSLDETMALAVGGGDFEAVGASELCLLEQIGFTSGHSLIDIGCGSGRLSSQLSKRFGTAITYLGVDVVPQLLEYAQERAPKYRFEITDGLTIPAADRSADFISAFSVFTHLRRAEAALYFREIYRALRPGGLLLFSFFEPRYNLRLLSSTSIRKLFGKCHPENHFFSRAMISQLATENNFITDRIFLPGPKNIGWHRPNHSFAVLRRATP